MLLRAQGLGPKDFGTNQTDVIYEITTRLGASFHDEVFEYPFLLEDGLYWSETDPYSSDAYSLSYPVGRTVCWSPTPPSPGERTVGFCAEFGGTSTSDLRFIGWRYSGPAGMLRTSSGLTIGSRWSDFPSVSFYALCYSYASATHSEIFLHLIADGFEWLTIDDLGGFEEHLPDPTVARVDYMQAGEYPRPYGEDC